MVLKPLTSEKFYANPKGKFFTQTGLKIKNLRPIPDSSGKNILAFSGVVDKGEIEIPFLWAAEKEVYKTLTGTVNNTLLVLEEMPFPKLMHNEKFNFTILATEEDLEYLYGTVLYSDDTDANNPRVGIVNRFIKDGFTEHETQEITLKF